jgi:putative ABC transport system permease protein
MRTLWQDVRYGIRRLRQSPGFTAIALLTLAVGIGANTIMFSISDALLLVRPRKVKAPEQLAFCALRGVDDSNFRYSEYLTIRDSGLAFREVMAQMFLPNRETVVREGSAWYMWSTFVSANYFSVLGVTPVPGRGFLPEEEQPGGAPVVVLSYRSWQRLGSDPKLVGQFVSINSIDCQVVGVAPEGFTGVTLDGPDLWLPMGCFRTVSRLGRSRADWKPWFYVVGRLKPEVTMSVAQAQLQTLFPDFQPERIKDKPSLNASFDLRPPGRKEIKGDNEQERRWNALISLVLVTVSTLILAIACLNLANMLIVQGAARQREVAVRLALGGSRWRIIRQLLIESGLLAVLGGGLAVPPALCGTRILNVAFAAKDAGLPLSLNVRVLAATLGLCLIATLLFGLRPALLLSRRDIAGEMKGAAGRVLGSLRRKRSGLSVAGQVALAVALALSAALLTRSALRIARPDPRFPLEDKLVVELDPEAGGYDRAQSRPACEALADHLASLPDVQALGITTRLFYGGGWAVDIGEYRPGDGKSAADEPLARQASFIDIGRDYFKAMEIPLLQGRLFRPLDSVPHAEKVAIIDETLARKLRPDGSPLGCLIRWSYLGDYSDPYRVVGIVAHLPGIEAREVRAQMYMPAEPNWSCPFFYLHVANKGSLGVLRQRIASEIRRFDPRLPILSVATLAERRNEDSWVWLARFGARLALAAGAAALFLAALGIYAIKGYLVASRMSEIGIRMALGATHGSIMGMVLREGLVLTVVGLLVGLLLGLGVAKVSARLLYGISPADPVSIAVTVALLGSAALLAGYFPARRAARIDPMVALRYE